MALDNLSLQSPIPGRYGAITFEHALTHAPGLEVLGYEYSKNFAPAPAGSLAATADNMARFNHISPISESA